MHDVTVALIASHVMSLSPYWWKPGNLDYDLEGQIGLETSKIWF